jgi:RHS repeat-associated protein
MRTDYTGAVAASYNSLPFGDGYAATIVKTAADQDNSHFTGLEQDSESNTAHAQFRQYSPAQGRWMSPDPYSGSYDPTNPQSMNRYSYVLNNPLSFVDPSGLSNCPPADSTCDSEGDSGDEGESGDSGDGGGGASGDSSYGNFMSPIQVFQNITVSGGDCLLSTYACQVYLSALLQSLLQGNGHGGGGGNAPSKTLGTCRVGGTPSHSQYAQAFASVTAMAAQFFSGLGTSENTFGSGSATSQVMAQSPGVQDAINGYNIYGKTSGNYNFGVSGAFAAGNNIVAQFVGGYSYSISPASGGINLSLSNYTSFRSLAADIGPSWARPYPMGTTHQTYNIFIPCP